MKKKLLVPTDLSRSSKAGIRFAIQLASQRPSTLIFLHVIDRSTPTAWNDAKLASHRRELLERETSVLRDFVQGVYKELKIRPGNVEYIVQYGASISETITRYSKENKASLICMSTHGAGTIRRLIGTHTSRIVKTSPVPVLVIPQNYRRRRLTHVMYASDFVDFKNEFQQVKDFAPSKTQISVLHYDNFLPWEKMKSALEKVTRRYKASNVNFHFLKFNYEHSLAEHLKKTMKRLRPSVLVMFTNHSRDWFEKVFFSSKSALITYDATRPILVIPKKGIF